MAPYAPESYTVQSPEPTGKFTIGLQLNSGIRIYDILNADRTRKDRNALIVIVSNAHPTDESIMERRYTIDLQFNVTSSNLKSISNVYRYGFLNLVIEEGWGSVSSIVIKSMPFNFTIPNLTANSAISIDYRVPISLDFVDPELMADPNTNHNRPVPDSVVLRLFYKTTLTIVPHKKAIPKIR